MVDVKPATPAARPSLRQERAAVTRRRIIDVARRHFFEDGYAATTLKDIALDADVAVQTVYAVFGSKAAILEELRSLVVFDPGAGEALRDAMTAPTADARLRAFARSIRERWEHAGDIVRVNEDAARVDHSLREGIATANAQRTAGITAFVQGIEATFELGLDTTRAVAVVHALSLYDVFEELTSRHGWAPEAYEAWLGDALVAGLLREPGSPARVG
ncbi:MAG: helix-turn-helix domain-containing protein [Chloroflexota bacterium]